MLVPFRMGTSMASPHKNLYKFAKTFLRISRIWNITLTWILARVFAYLPPFIAQILDFISRIYSLKTRNSNYQCHPLQFLTVMTSLPNFISANQHFASTCSMQIFKSLRHDCKLSFLFRPAFRAPRRTYILSTKCSNRPYYLPCRRFRFFPENWKSKRSLLIKAKSCAEGSNSGECTQL